MHLKNITLHPDQYPNKDLYPFNLPLFNKPIEIHLDSPITFFIGENGTGKSTLLEAIAHRCSIHIWRDEVKTRYESNPYEEMLYRFISVGWENGPVPGSYFGSDTFKDFSKYLDEWAIADPYILKYFGGKSLITQSHGQSLMSLFRKRYKIKGLYLLDEPETALSPKSQLELLKIIKGMSEAGHAQFIIASHSPILLACPDSKIFCFDNNNLRCMDYEETEYYKVYRAFMMDRTKYLS
ncbi:AAA family ATPase [Thermodesulfobacteriota bacterium]